MDVNGDFIAGFVAGEGCFHIAVERKKESARPNVRAMFTIQLRADDKDMLRQIKEYFKCGNINEYKRKNGQHIAYYRVGRIDDLINIIIPFFERYPLRAKKQMDYDIWKSIVYMIRDKLHLQEKYITKIMEYKSQMNL